MIDCKFIHLRTHSDFSMTDGLVKPEVLVKKAEKLGMPSIAMTDNSNVHGLIKFYKESFHLGVKPIIGVDCKILLDEKFNLSNVFTKITLLAVNNLGYSNILFLLSLAYKCGYDSKFGIILKKQWLMERNKGILLLSGGCDGEIGVGILYNKKQLVLECLLFYEKYFKNLYYLEVIRIGKPREEEYIYDIKNLSIREGIPVVATNEVCFIHENDFEAHKIRVFINKGYTLKDNLIYHNYTSQQYMKTSDQMCELFSDFPDAVKNSVEISKRCNVVLCFDKYFLPKFSQKNIDVDNYLVREAKKGLKKRLIQLYSDSDIRLKNFNKYYSRLLSELTVIQKMGFSGYFLIVMEFITWAKKNNIPVGPGRGSGAGSLVSYVLNITELDPLCFDLLFERFLNPERSSMPDLDIDFCMEKRDQVIEHVSNVYGTESVSQIITFGTLTAKAVIRDVGRVFGFPYGFLNRVSKLVPSDPGMTLTKALLKRSELLALYNNDDDVKSLIDMAKKLEGVTRNVSKHAGGVVISPSKITDFSPLYCDENGNNSVTQFDKNDIECIGLVKFDFLGLKNLTIIYNAVNIINSQLLINQKKLININFISLKDKNCFNFLRSSKTVAVFQLESSGMKDLIKRLHPDSFEDLVALIALFRPGPLKSGMVDNFINRKHGREIISYPDQNCQHILLKPILESTYGIILYQEQVMKIAQVLANYTLGNADLLRRIMEKKDQLEMNKQRIIFQKKAQENGINKNLSIKIFNLLEKFAGYAFNKSHSVAYALISYQTLWLKVYYPEEFMVSAINADIDNIEKIVSLVCECKKMKLKIIPPNINISNYYFYVDSFKNIIYGLGAIKGIGKSIVSEIISVRKKNKKFTELFNLYVSVNSKKLTKRVIERLIMSGSLDCFCLDRSVFLNLYEKIIKSANQYLTSVLLKKNSLFESSLLQEFKSIRDHFDLTNTNKFSKKEILNFEKDSLGLYLSEHPVDEYVELAKKKFNAIRLQNYCYKKNQNNVSILGMITILKFKITKTKKRMVFFVLEDNFCRLDVIVFDNVLNRYQNILEKDKVIIVVGNIKSSIFNKNIVIIANKLISV